MELSIPDTARPAIDYLLKVLASTSIQFVHVLVPLLLLALVMHLVATTFEGRFMSRFGYRAYIRLIGWLGVPIHELSHWIFCKIFGHRVVELKLFDPDPQTGYLGYVVHRWDQGNIYHRIGNFFIGIGPVIGGTAIITLLLHVLTEAGFFHGSSGRPLITPGEEQSAISTAKGLTSGMIGCTEVALHFLWGLATPERLTDWRTYAFLYVVFCVGGTVSLSPSDIKGSLFGLANVLLLVVIANAATIWRGDYLTEGARTIGAFLIPAYQAMIVAILLYLVVWLLLLELPLALIRIFRRVRA